MKRILLIAIIVLMGALGSAGAQMPLAALPKPAPAPAPATQAVSLTPAQAQQALDVLNDPAKRGQIVTVLEAIAKALPATPSGAAAAAAPGGAAGIAEGHLPIPLAPDSLGAEVLQGASQRLSSMTNDIVVTAQSVNDFPLVERWFRHLMTDPVAQAAMLETAWRLAVVVVCALAVEWALARLLRRPMQALEAHAPEGRPAGDPDSGEPESAPGTPERKRRGPSALTLFRRLPYVLAHFLLDVLPVLSVVAVGYAMLGAGLAPDLTTRLVVMAVLNAYILCRAITCAVRLLMAPGAPRLRLLHSSDETAVYVLRWVRRIAAVAVFGFAFTEVGVLFGLYKAAHDALLKAVMLVDHAFLVVIVVQKRAQVAEWIAARPGKRGALALLRNRFARVWHIVAIFYIVALWMVWAFEVPNGFSRLLRIFLSTVIVLAVARLVAIMLNGMVDRAMKISPDLAARYPGLESRARSYHPVARTLVTIVVGFASVVALFQAWGIDAIDWFSTGALGSRLVSALVTIGITLVVSLFIWESSNVAIQQHLARLAREAQAARSARIRTLLPMFRTTLLVSICTVAALMILSEIGVNIAPLLAGAGVIGLAIGFGSQKLVQDIITGLFLLLENAMQVGDVVSLGGLSGTVENLSIRTIRLRALDGSVHIVPFSAVTTVTNMTRDFSYALLDVSVGVNEEPDRIADVLRDVARKMRSEPRWESALRDDIDIMGVEKFVDTAWVLRARIKTLPGQRWAVARELNRRIKYCFDELAIESPMTSYKVLSASTAAAATEAEAASQSVSDQPVPAQPVAAQPVPAQPVPAETHA